MTSQEKASGREAPLKLTRSDFVSLAAARAGMYDFLTVLCTKPTAQVVDSLLKRSATLSTGMHGPKGLGEAMERFRSSSPDLSPDGELALQVDWTRLFRGIAKGYSPPPPYESVYKEGLLGGPTSAAVARTYAANGVGLSGKSNEMPDYIGVEFKFMSTLALEESRAWGDDPSKALKLIGDQKQFAREHMGVWIPRFCREAKKLAKTKFYEGVIDVIESIFSWDLELIESVEETASGTFQGEQAA